MNPFWAPIMAVLALLGPINAPVEVATPAIRLNNQVQVTDTLPPPNPRDVVNGLPYQLEQAGPAKEAWYIVTATHGWSPELQAAWWPFSNDVLYGESGYCWNRLRGDVMVFPPSGCRQVRQGTHEDAGFAQLTSVHYAPGNWLCTLHGICDKWTIISEPWISMEVFIWLLEREGSQPWCFSDSIRQYHKCSLAPDR